MSVDESSVASAPAPAPLAGAELSDSDGEYDLSSLVVRG